MYKCPKRCEKCPKPCENSPKHFKKCPKPCGKCPKPRRKHSITLNKYSQSHTLKDNLIDLYKKVTKGWWV
jgi:hypothetical protein